MHDAEGVDEKEAAWPMTEQSRGPLVRHSMNLSFADSHSLHLQPKSPTAGNLPSKSSLTLRAPNRPVRPVPHRALRSLHCANILPAALPLRLPMFHFPVHTHN